MKSLSSKLYFFVCEHGPNITSLCRFKSKCVLTSGAFRWSCSNVVDRIVAEKGRGKSIELQSICHAELTIYQRRKVYKQFENKEHVIMEMYKVYHQGFLFEFYKDCSIEVVLHHYLIYFHVFYLMFLEKDIAN